MRGMYEKCKECIGYIQEQEVVEETRKNNYSECKQQKNDPFEGLQRIVKEKHFASMA
jgi:hypothetical protein